MKDWFSIIGAKCELSAEAVRQLSDVGFVIIPGPVPADKMAQMAADYDSAVDSASSDDVRVGSTTTRVTDFVNRGAEFDELYVYRPLLEACYHVIGQPFKLSSMHARTVRPNTKAQGLHIDFQPDESRYPLIGFILMIDDFTSDNGATRFVPGSHQWLSVPEALINDPVSAHENQIVACGQAGSIIVFNGAVWHGHTANSSGRPRRSIQGAYIGRGEKSWTDLPARMRPETLARISPLAKYLLNL